jgi:hypothetical protein
MMNADQVARALQMHKTGVFVLNPTAFSEKDFGNDTAIYLKLIGELSDSRWTASYSGLEFTGKIEDELRKFPKANREPPSETKLMFIIFAALIRLMLARICALA